MAVHRQAGQALVERLGWTVEIVLLVLIVLCVLALDPLPTW